MERKVAWESYSEDQLEELEALSKRYIDFISENKTERRCFSASVAQVQAAGYISLEEAIAKANHSNQVIRYGAESMTRRLYLFISVKIPSNRVLIS